MEPGGLLVPPIGLASYQTLVARPAFVRFSSDAALRPRQVHADEVLGHGHGRGLDDSVLDLYGHGSKIGLVFRALERLVRSQALPRRRIVAARHADPPMPAFLPWAIVERLQLVPLALHGILHHAFPSG